MTTAPAPGDTELDQALHLTPTGDGEFSTELSDGWLIGPAVNGGLLLAVLGRALGITLGASGHPDPLAVSAYFLSAGRPGPATVRTELVREGRSMATGQASVLQTGADGVPVERVRALATYGDLDALTSDVRTFATPPDLPPLEDCVGSEVSPSGMPGGGIPFMQRIDLRLDPSTAGWALGEPTGRGVIQGWLRMADGHEPDPLMLLLAVDALPPVTFDLGLRGWTPTLELTAHVRARPAPGWLRVRASTRNLAGGLLEEDAEVWDSQDRLVAQSRQLARAPER